MMFGRSLVSLLPSLTTILRIVWTGPVPLRTCDDVQNIFSGTCELSLDRQVLSCRTNLDSFDGFPPLSGFTAKGTQFAVGAVTAPEAILSVSTEQV